MRNNLECVRALLEDSNIDVLEKTDPNEETPIIIACKYNVGIEILESLLVSLRNLLPIDELKEYLELKDKAECKAYDYCKSKKRSDLAVILEEFVDTTKSVLDIGFSYVEGFDFKAEVRNLYAK